MKFSIHPVIPEDVDALDLKECYAIGEIGCVKDLVSLSFARNYDSLAVGIGSPGELQGVLGSYRSWSGVAQLWGLLDRRVEQNPVALRKVCLQLMELARQKQELRRVSLTVRAGYTKGNRFAQSLGFAFEGRMYGFMPDGDDANLFARLF